MHVFAFWNSNNVPTNHKTNDTRDKGVFDLCYKEHKRN